MAYSPASGSYSRFRKLLGYLRTHRTVTIAGIVTLLGVNLLGVYIPLIIRDGVDELQGDFNLDRLLALVPLVLVLASVMWVMRMTSRMLIFGVGRRVEFDLKQTIFEHLLTLDPAYFARNTIGDLINRSTSDVDNIRRLLGFAVLSLVNTFFAYGFTLPMMLLINVRLSLMAIAVYPLMLFMVMLFSDRLRVQQGDVQEALSHLSELVQEDLSGIGLIKIYAQEDNERRAFRVINDRLLQANLKLAKTRNMLFPLLEGLASVSLLVLLAFGAGSITLESTAPMPAGSLTVGSFIALILYAERMVFPTALLGFTLTAYQRGEVSIDRIETILLAETKIRDAADALVLDPAEVQGWLKADHLTLTYPGAATPALQEVSFQIAPGETVAIVGPIGSGKSTLANVLPRLLNVAPGQLFLEGIDVTRITLDSLRRVIAYVPQESFLFSTTIRENVRYGDPLRSQDEVQAAAQAAQIHLEILNFPQTYDTLVGERGITLSGGQRQRTALARALLMDAPILILDDALSSVDNQTATAILHNLSQGSQRKTVIFISHQLSAAAIADRILVMDQGRIIQAGSHQDLLAEGGLYRSLWDRQTLEAVVRS
ncbi:ABC transporter ATP-binding protein [Prochlorothrix hollandica]|uniref:Membrane protein n=1 Tax=Prochlorothrix hollandica PCC 9006 = CALU 1027 TaxID=317619 RepID=A0A0M2PZW9_PROHO|nr:ABC transporter ATP-binding protein [Prochlorothrix hollandica]KKI99926.1 membrane protein [Prochlorothrix hollandica PCC 9006 = CALU 1027]